MKDAYVKAKAIKPLEEHINISHPDFGLSNSFLDTTPSN